MSRKTLRSKEVYTGAKYYDIEIKQGLYEKYLKHIFDIMCSLLSLLLFGWLYIIIAFLVRIKLGSPVIFKQPRPGMIDQKTGEEKVFLLYKFRTMTEERDKNGKLLPDEARLTNFGKWLRSTSLDELPEVFNILRGEMSVIGPRPQLIVDMVFMDDKQRKRHMVRPGLSGLAQVNGRNDINWEEKLNWDLRYIEKITFLGDLRIIGQTVMKAFIKREGITEGDMATAQDFGDYLLSQKRIGIEEYNTKQEKAKKILEKYYAVQSRK